LGLRTMRNRSRMIQASLSLEPVKPHGTRVTCTVIKERRDESQRGRESDGHGLDRG
jgi:nitrate/nitrite-specific signal transduction histidine kinase